MRKTVLTFLFFLGCYSWALAQLASFYVQPIQTDSKYAAAQDSHYVAVNPSVSSRDELLLFFGGTGSKPKDYTDFPNLAANLGYNAIDLAYLDGTSVDRACSANSDTSCFRNFRQEVCYGTPVSSAVDVDSLNSIYTRTVDLLQYLATKYPDQHWDHFFSGDSILWSKVVVSGHSQGSGHALYFAKQHTCARLIMFSGADDYSTYYGSPPGWVSWKSKTPLNDFYSFLHLEDDVISYSKQYKIVKALGMMSNGDDSTIVDNKVSPYNHSHLLYTDAKPRFQIYSATHDAPVVDFFTPRNSAGGLLFEPVWEYMLTNKISTGIQYAPGQKPDRIALYQNYPNPFNPTTTISYSLDSAQYVSLKVYDILGRVVNTLIDGRQTTGTHHVRFDASRLASGLYIYRLQAGSRVITKKMMLVK